MKQVTQFSSCQIRTYGSDHTADGQTNGNTKAFQTFIRCFRKTLYAGTHIKGKTDGLKNLSHIKRPLAPKELKTNRTKQVCAQSCCHPPEGRIGFLFSNIGQQKQTQKLYGCSYSASPPRSAIINDRKLPTGR